MRYFIMVSLLSLGCGISTPADPNDAARHWAQGMGYILIGQPQCVVLDSEWWSSCSVRVEQHTAPLQLSCRLYPPAGCKLAEGVHQ